MMMYLTLRNRMIKILRITKITSIVRLYKWWMTKKYRIKQLLFNFWNSYSPHFGLSIAVKCMAPVAALPLLFENRPPSKQDEELIFLGNIFSHLDIHSLLRVYTNFNLVILVLQDLQHDIVSKNYLISFPL